MKPLQVLLLPAGSAGDVNPFAGLAVGLRARGHEVTVASNGHFRSLFESLDVRFIEIGDEALFESVVHDPALWRPGPDGLRLLMRMGAMLIEQQYRLACDHAAGPRALAVAGVLALGARVARETCRLPLATVQLAPVALPSIDSPPRLPGSPVRAWMPRWLRVALTAMIDRFADSLCQGVADFRRAKGLAPVRGLITRWANSPDRVLGLFPDWFTPAPPDWPAQLRLSGFPLWDRPATKQLPADARAFLDQCGAQRPLVFAPGSANAQARGFFAAAAAACARLGRPGVLLTPYAGQVPASLPARVARFDYLPLSLLLPRAEALISHGGIGTLSQGLAAGLPQLVMPMSFDQPDNMQRMAALGVARELPPRRFDADHLVVALRSLLADESVRQAARVCAARVRDDGDALARTCDLVEEMHDEALHGVAPAV